MEADEPESARSSHHLVDLLRPMLRRLYMPRLGPVPMELLQRLKRIEASLAKRRRT